MTHEQPDTTSHPEAAIRRLAPSADPYAAAREAVQWGVEQGLIKRPTAAIDDDQPDQPPQPGPRRDPFAHMRPPTPG